MCDFHDSAAVLFFFNVHYTPDFRAVLWCLNLDTKWQKSYIYKNRILANNTPLLIKPPLQPNLNKPPLFCLKSPLFKAFWGKNKKNSINLHQKTLKFL